MSPVCPAASTEGQAVSRCLPPPAAPHCSCALPRAWKQAFLQGGRSAQSSGRKYVALAGLFSTSEPAEQSQLAEPPLQFS